MSHIVKIIHPRHCVDMKVNRREFRIISTEDLGGFSFPVDAKGNVCEKDLTELGLANFKMCLSHPEIYEDLGAINYSNTYIEPAEAMCSCGSRVMLDGDCRCGRCGQWYNLWGQALLSPEFWNYQE